MATNGTQQVLSFEITTNRHGVLKKFARLKKHNRNYGMKRKVLSSKFCSCAASVSSGDFMLL